jgi:D-alanyl-D-alanine carboxypeptidase
MKPMRYSLSAITVMLLVLQMLCLSSFALAQEKKALSADDIDTIANKVMKQKNIPGLAVAVALDDGTTMARSYGFAELEQIVPVQSDTIFPVGSISKTFTAIAVLMLQEEGKLSVTDKLIKYFPDYPSGEGITLKHLLQHTSGIKEIVTIEPFKSNQMKDWTPQQLIAIMKTQPLDFEPGQKAQYSNSGYILLGLIIEKVTGLPYADFIEQRITKPLGMSNTMMGSNSLLIPRRAAGYVFSGKTHKNAESVSISSLYAGGGIMSTPSDLVKLMRVFKGTVFLKQKSIDEMFGHVRLNNGQEFFIPGTGLDITYGYGLDILKKGNEIVPGKTGSISGFTAYIAYYKEKGMLITVTANLANSLFDLLEIVRTIAAARN